MSGVTVVTSGGFNQNPAVSVAVTLGAVSVDDVIVVAFSRSSPSDTDTMAADTVADNLGNTYTLIPAHVFDSSDDQSMAQYVCLVTVAGTPTITATSSEGSSGFMFIGAVAFRGLINSSGVLLDAYGVSGGSPQRSLVLDQNTTVCTLSPVSGSALIVAALGDVNDFAVIRPIGLIQQLLVATNNLILAYGIVAASGPYNVQVQRSPATGVASAVLASAVALKIAVPDANVGIREVPSRHFGPF